jgi:AcrR family transcriptional regulator
MPKKPRSKNEIDTIKEDILKHALDLMQEEGYEGFSMRKLSSRLGVSVVTLYRFYENKDHIYLVVLTRGFQLLYRECLKAYKSEKKPEDRLRSMTEAYISFGITRSNFYNLMFTWHVPKYEDYIGTPMEDVAKCELEESQKSYLLTIKAVKELVKKIGNITLTDNEIRSHIIYFWSTLHGYIAGMNNNLLNYMHEDPLSLKESIIDNLFSSLHVLIDENLKRKRN